MNDAVAGKGVKVVRFLSLLFVALTLGPSLAHLFELPNKINLSVEDYFTVQNVYRGWALLGFVVFGALLSTLLPTIRLRHRGKPFTLSLIAFLCIVGTQVIFLDFHLSGERADEQLDDHSGKLDGSARPVGILSRRRRGA